jgi:phospholipid/cholesterol/gamma-HCH transport system substrate-binding protein
MMRQTKVLETWVGLFVAFGLVAIFFMAMQVSNLSDLRIDDRSYRITARFANAGSLKLRAPVSIAGVRVGRVTGVRFDKQSYEAVVEMRIEPEYDTLPSDTTASVLTQGLLGEQYVGLSPGGTDEYLKDGDEIELTQSALVLEEIISRFLFNKAESGSDKPVSERGEEAPAKPEGAKATTQDKPDRPVGAVPLDEPPAQ